MKKTYFILIFILTIVLVFSKSFSEEETACIDKAYEVIKLLKYDSFLIKDNIYRTDIQILLPEKTNYLCLYDNKALEITLIYKDEKSFLYIFDESNKLHYLYCGNRMKDDPKYINFINKYYPRELSEKELLKQARKYLRILFPDIDQKEFRMRDFRSYIDRYSKEKIVFIDYCRNINGFESSEAIYLSLFPNGLLYTSKAMFTDEYCDVNIKISKEEAEKKSLELIKQKINNNNGFTELILENRILKTKKITDEQTKIITKRDIKKKYLLDSERILDLSKPIIIHPNYNFFKDSNSILKKENRKPYYYNQGIKKLRAAWVTIVSIGDYRNIVETKKNFYVVYIDCETGEIIGGY